MSSPTADPGRLGAEDIRRRKGVLAKWQRHSTFIHVLRRLLPAVCIATLLVLAGWATANTLFWRLGVQAQKGNLVIRMLRPDFQGRDDKGQPYTLNAASALRDDADPAKITLDAPVFTLGAAKVDQTRVQARHGVYREDSRVLNLTGDVHLTDSQGYEFVTEHAVIDTQLNNVDGDQYIEGHGPLGRIAASSYAIRGGGAHVYFTGQVKARIEHHAPAPDPAATAKR